MKRLIKSLLRRAGYELTPVRDDSHDELADLEPWQREIIVRVQPLTMTGIARSAALVHAVTHLSRRGVPGDIAECGVWRGGSMMAVALTLLSLGDTGRELWLYDTFAGMTAPSDSDVSHDGRPAMAEFAKHQEAGGGWCSSGLQEVRKNLESTGYPMNRVHFVEGKVEETIPAATPGPLALLRLDTDWYESTRHELRHLFPLLHEDGILLIDDYGHWQGARRAVDEFFSRAVHPVYFQRIDYTGRLLAGAGRVRIAAP